MVFQGERTEKTHDYFMGIMNNGQIEGAVIVNLKTGEIERNLAMPMFQRRFVEEAYDISRSGKTILLNEIPPSLTQNGNTYTCFSKRIIEDLCDTFTCYFGHERNLENPFL